MSWALSFSLDVSNGRSTVVTSHNLRTSDQRTALTMQVAVGPLPSLLGVLLSRSLCHTCSADCIALALVLLTPMYVSLSASTDRGMP